MVKQFWTWLAVKWRYENCFFHIRSNAGTNDTTITIPCKNFAGKKTNFKLFLRAMEVSFLLLLNKKRHINLKERGLLNRV